MHFVEAIEKNCFDEVPYFLAQATLDTSLSVD
jgi:hypothetical protein